MKSASRIEVDLPKLIGKGYGEFWRFQGRYRVCKGSRASKKSKTTALNLIYRMMRYPLANTLVIRRTFNTLRDSCWSDLQWAARRLRVSHLWSFTSSPLAAVYQPTGQQVFFRGLDDPQKLASISCSVGYLCWCWVEEAYELESESDFDMIDDTIRGELPKGYFKQITLTFNPWSPSSWLKARFFDVPPNEELLAMTTTYRCNEWLDEADKRRFEEMKRRNPKRFRVAGDGDWGIEAGQFFEEFTDVPEHYLDRRWTHVIEPFAPQHGWTLCRSYDFGYGKPFSCAWWAVDYDGVLYRILELYGCTQTPNEGLRWTPDRQFEEIARIEREHPWLRGREISGVADPSIWDASRGESIAETAMKHRVYFTKGDNQRIPGWMQCHYRLQFDADGYPRMYVFRNCHAFRRTIPLLTFSQTKPEDLNTDLEDHVADEWRYLCMSRPIRPLPSQGRQTILSDPLNQF